MNAWYCYSCGKGLEPKEHYCDPCIKKLKEHKGSSKVVTINKTYIPGYGNVSDSRIKEMERRVILPYDAPDGGYYVGRRGENGKIQEREPNYHK